jgi:hypothetical protein
MGTKSEPIVLPTASQYRRNEKNRDVPDVIPPPPIPAIALAAIKVFILGAKAHNVVPKPTLSSSFHHSPSRGGGHTKE